MKDILIVYYSLTGNVKKMAQEMAQKRDADLYEIKDLVKRNGILGFTKSGYHALFKKCTPIAPVNIDFEQYKTVIVCGPVWAGNIDSPVRTFLKKYAGSIAKIEYVIMCGDKNKQYTEIFNELDRITGKKNSGAKCLHHGEKF